VQRVCRVLQQGRLRQRRIWPVLECRLPMKKKTLKTLMTWWWWWYDDLVTQKKNKI
jgi:hypothetical protein